MKIQGNRAKIAKVHKNQSLSKSSTHIPSSKFKTKHNFFSKLFITKKYKEPPKTLKGKALLWTKRVAIAFCLVLLLGIVGGSIALAVLINKYSQGLPELGDKLFDQVKTQGVSVITDRNNQELYRLIGDKVYDYQKVDTLNSKFKWSIIAVENPTFYDDSGVSVDGIARAIYTTYIKREGIVGGSTITQQVVKNLVLADQKNRNTETKIREAVLAMQLTNKYSKSNILELYINSLPMGGQYYGVKKASQIYFHLDQKDLNLAQAAFLAGLPNCPTSCSPLTTHAPVKDINGNDIQLGILRQKEVLNALQKLVGKKDVDITSKDIEEAKNFKLEFNIQLIDKKAPWFVDYVIHQLDNMYKDKDPNGNGIEYVKNANLTIKTSLNSDFQNIAENENAKVRDIGINAQNAAMETIDVKTGEILMMVGSRNYNEKSTDPRFDPQVNLTDSYDSPGSSIKPWNYLNYFIQGHGGSTIVPNIRLNFGSEKNPYIPFNYSHTYGSVSQTIGPNGQSGAFYHSLNVPAAEVLLGQGVDSFAQFMQKLGFDDYEVSQIKVNGVTSTLGSAYLKPLHQARAFQILANGGLKTPLISILQITDTSNTVVYTPDRTTIRVYDEAQAYLITDLIRNYYAAGTVLNNGWKDYLAGKTGTNDACEAPGQLGSPTAISFYGFTKDIVTGAIAMNNNNACLIQNADGSAVGVSLWQSYMNRILPQYLKTKQPFVKPAGVVTKQICKDTGLLFVAGDNCDKISGNVIDASFGQNALPSIDKNHYAAVIAKCMDGTEKLANAQQIAAGQSSTKTYVQIPAPYPPTQSQVDAASGFVYPPKDTCVGFSSDTGQIAIQLSSPSDGMSVGAGANFPISGTAVSNADIKNVYFNFDSSPIGSSNSGNFSLSYTIPSNTANGQHQLVINATDVNGATGSKTVLINVTGGSGTATNNVTINITSPGGNVSQGNQQLNAVLNDATNVSSLQFMIQQNGIPTSYTIQGNKTGNNYNGTFDFIKKPSNQYTIVATVKFSNGETKSSSPVNILVQ